MKKGSRADRLLRQTEGSNCGYMSESALLDGVDVGVFARSAKIARCDIRGKIFSLFA